MPMATGKMRYELVVHGWLMYIPFGLLFPLGIIVARFMQHARKHGHPSSTLRLLFNTHLALQVDLST